MTRLKYPPRKRSINADAGSPRSTKPSALPKSKRLRAKFIDADGRYATINGISYPVLLTSCLSGCRYEEDMRDTAEFPAEWCRRFVQDLRCRVAAILASDVDDQNWTFLGLFQIHHVQLSNFLICEVGAKLTSIQLLPAPSRSVRRMPL